MVSPQPCEGVLVGRRAALSSIAATVAASVLAACGDAAPTAAPKPAEPTKAPAAPAPTTAPAAAPTAAKPAESAAKTVPTVISAQTELVVWINDHGPEVQKWFDEELMPAFKKEQPNVKIAVKWENWTGVADRLNQVLAAGSLPGANSPTTLPWAMPMEPWKRPLSLMMVPP